MTLFDRLLDKFRSRGVKRIIIYSASLGFNAVLAFLVLPVLTRYLSPYDYGVVETFMVIAAVLCNLILLGGTTLVTKEYFNLERPERENYIGNILGVMAFAALIILFFLFVFKYFGGSLSNLFKIDNFLLLLAVIVAFCNAVISMLANLFRLEKNANKYAALMNSRALTDAFISIFLVVVFGLKWQGRISGFVAANMIFAVIAFYLFRSRKISFRFSKERWAGIFLLGFPLTLSDAFGYLNEFLNKIMINIFVGVSSTGIFSIGLKFAMIVSLLNIAFFYAWDPYFFENLRKNSHSSNLQIVKRTYLYFFVLFAFSLLIGFFGKYLLFLMVDKKFFSAQNYILVMSLAYFISGVGGMFLNYLIYKGKTMIYLVVILIATFVNIFANFILLQKYGPIGAAWATIASFSVTAVLAIILASRLHPMPWFLNRSSGDNI